MTLEQKRFLDNTENPHLQIGNDRALHNFDAWEKYALKNGMKEDVKQMQEELAQVDKQKQSDPQILEALHNFDAIEKPLFRKELGGLKTDTLIAATNLNKET